MREGRVARLREKVIVGSEECERKERLILSAASRAKRREFCVPRVRILRHPRRVVVMRLVSRELDPPLPVVAPYHE